VKITDTTAKAAMLTAPPTWSGLSKKRTKNKSTAPAAVEIQARGRHRRDDSRPVGNSSMSKGARVSATCPPNPSTWEMVLGAASDPGSTSV
jgi:hypothetical protein